MNADKIGNAIRLCNGNYFELKGTYWAWPIDGYYDLHFTDTGVRPDGSDVVSEGLHTLKAARTEAKELTKIGNWNIS